MIIHQTNIKEYWKEENLPPFYELILSWNAARPQKGDYLFYISVKTSEWTDWLLYASWGENGQRSYLETTLNQQVKIFQDTLMVMGHQPATGFQIQIVSKDGISIDNIRNLHVYIDSDAQDNSTHKSSSFLPICQQFSLSTRSMPALQRADTLDPNEQGALAPDEERYEEDASVIQPVSGRERELLAICLQVPGISQIALNHPRNRDLCSPTSTTAIIRFLSNNQTINPIDFAHNVLDSGFDLFGNWVLNMAQAAHEMGNNWSCWVERLNNFEDIYQKLENGTPVIVSVRGPLKGSALPYLSGHLIVIIGYDPIEAHVICMDPAFSSDDNTHVTYPYGDFIQAWTRRGNIAYVFDRNT